MCLNMCSNRKSLEYLKMGGPRIEWQTYIRTALIMGAMTSSAQICTGQMRFDNVAAIMCMWLGDTDYISVHLYTTPQLFWAQIYDWVRYSQTMFRMGQVCLFCATNLFFVFSLERLSYLNKIPPWINHKHWRRNWKIWAVHFLR